MRWSGCSLNDNSKERKSLRSERYIELLAVGRREATFKNLADFEDCRNVGGTVSVRRPAINLRPLSPAVRRERCHKQTSTSKKENPKNLVNFSRSENFW
jgi:hypothetical protein